MYFPLVTHHGAASAKEWTHPIRFGAVQWLLHRQQMDSSERPPLLPLIVGYHLLDWSLQAMYRTLLDKRYSSNSSREDCCCQSHNRSLPKLGSSHAM